MKVELGTVLVVCAAVLLAACQPAPTVALPTSTARAPTATVEVPPQVVELATAEPVTATPEPTVPAGTLLRETVALSAGGGAVLTFAGRALETVRVDVETTGGAAAFNFSLVDVFGNRLATVQDGGLSEITLPSGGTYRLELEPQSGSAVLDVSVTRLAEPSEAWRLTGPEVQASGTLGGAGAVHSYIFPLEAGRVVAVEALAGSGDPLPVQVLGPGGEPAGEGATFVAPHTGDYAALVGGGGASGDYTLHVRRADVPPEPVGEPDVEVGRDYRAVLVEGSLLALTFDAAPGDGLRVEVVGAEEPLATDIHLVSPFGHVLAYASGQTQAAGTSIAEVQLPYAGRYSVEIRPRSSGQAWIRLARLEPAALTGGGELEGVRAERTGRIAGPGVFHTYRFEGAMGDVVSLVVSPAPGTRTLVPALALVGPEGRQLALSTGTDQGDTVETTLGRYRLPQTGTYYVVVYGVTGGTGLYRLIYERQG
ncbi:MAG TPA: hypothetical protein VKY39_08985 [Aggregatilineales bacterium]|nr:hypothetical protein [Aggregatilineales bacterium]